VLYQLSYVGGAFTVAGLWPKQEAPNGSANAHSEPIAESVVVPVLVAAGFIVGLALGRWWALVGAVAVGIAVGFTSEVEVSPIVLGVGYGVVTAFAIAMGVALRRAVGRRAA
jgi:hypothetical protein